MTPDFSSPAASGDVIAFFFPWMHSSSGRELPECLLACFKFCSRCHFEADRLLGLVDVISIVSGSRNVQIRWFWPINSLSLLRPTPLVSGNAIKWLHAFSLSASFSLLLLPLILLILPQKSSGPSSLDLRKFRLRGWIEKGLSYSRLSLYRRPIKTGELKTAGAHWRVRLCSPGQKRNRSCCFCTMSRQEDEALNEILTRPPRVWWNYLVPLDSV